MVDFVVSKHTENIEWLEDLKSGLPTSRFFIYDKGPTPSPNHIPLSNIGREAETFLHHIISHYDDLAPLTILLQGNPFGHLTISKEEFIASVIEDPAAAKNVQWWIFAQCTPDGKPHHPNLPIVQCYEELFDSPVPSNLTFLTGAQYPITKERVHLRSKAFYESLRDKLISPDHPLCAWTMERLWPSIWDSRLQIRSST